MDFGKIVKNTKYSFINHSPEILTGIGISGMITTTIMAVKATPKAVKIISQKEEEKGEILTPIETIKVTWKNYIPAAVIGIISTSCLICANNVNTKRNAALATAYSISETALRDYKDKVVETIGEKREKTVKEAIAQDKIDNNPVVQENIIHTGKGNTLCYDLMFGRYFTCDVDVIEKAINRVNRNINIEGYASLNDFYVEIGLEPTEIGDCLGWNIDSREIIIERSSHLINGDTPCFAMSFNKAPKYEFDRI